MGQSGQVTSPAPRGVQPVIVELEPEASGPEGSKRSTRQWLPGLLGMAVPVGAYLWLIHRFSVNVLFRDEFDQIKVIAHPSFGNLWAQHAEDRLFFQNLLALLLARTTHLNVVFEVYVSALLLVGSLGLLVFTCWRRDKSRNLLWYCPLAFLLFSFVQYENTLLGFQIGWYLVIAALAVSILLLDTQRLTWVALVGAMAAGVIGTFSSIQGFMIWPAGFVLMYQRRRDLRKHVAWLGTGCISALAYFYHWSLRAASINGSGIHSSSYLLHHPLYTLEFLAFLVGDVVGQTIPNAPHAQNDIVVAFGAMLLVIGIWLFARFGLRQDKNTVAPIGFAVMVFGLLFAVEVTLGRASAGSLWWASISRYTSASITFLAGVYLVVLGLWQRQARRKNAPLSLAAASYAIATAVCIQVPSGYVNGIAGARHYNGNFVTAQDLLVNIAAIPNNWVQYFLAPLESPSFIRQMAALGDERRLSIFATSAASSYRKLGVVTGWNGEGHSPASPPVLPWRNVVSGQLVEIRAQLRVSGSGPVYLSECNEEALSQGEQACQESESVRTVAKKGKVDATFTVFTGSVGDGSCSAGQSCFIRAQQSNGDVSWAEIWFRSAPPRTSSTTTTNTGVDH